MIDRVPETDNDIIARFRVDKEEAWRMIYERCHSKAMGFMRSQFRSGVDFEDVFQEACIVLHNKLQDPNFTFTSTIQTYINGVCKNILLKQHKRQPDYSSFEPEYVLALALEVELDEEEFSVRRNIFTEVIEQMRFQSNRCYEIFQLVFYKNIGMQQIADRLGYSSAANVRQQKYKCLAKSKREIEKRLNPNTSRS
jgi:RNA polymerase sigma factor (sigma-70 family)